MLLLLVLLVEWRLTTCMSSPTLEDNMVPTDEEVIRDLINLYHGQPEQEIPLNLPTDEEAFNEIKPMLYAGSPFYYSGGGIGHFVSSSFPEVDARGFHESVFDNLDDFYSPIQRGKKYDPSVPIRARGFYGDVFTDGFGSFHPVKRFHRNKYIPNRYYKSFRNFLGSRLLKNRSKRSVMNTDPSETSSEVNNFQKAAPFSTVDPNVERTSQIRTCLVENDIENCEVKLRIVLKNDLDNQKFWQIINSNREADPFNGSAKYERLKRSPRVLDSQYGPEFWRNYPDLFFHLLKVNRYPKHKPQSINSDVLSLEQLKKRRPEQDMTGLEQGVFNEFGGFDTLRKRVPEIGSSGFHGDVFNDEFGNFETLRKRVPEHFHHNDVFSHDFGNFQPHKRVPGSENLNGDAFNRDFGHFNTLKRRDTGQYKRKPDTFNGDAFHQDFGYFDTVKRRPGDDVNGDAFHTNFGNFETLKRNADEFEDHFGGAFKRKLASALTGDAFHNSFGNFETLKKRKPSSPADGFSEDAFHQQFSNFETLRKRTPEDINSDAFHSNFGNFNTMKRRPESLSGDAFHSSFGNFETLKKRRPDLLTFEDDAFHNQFGNFDPMRKRRPGEDFSENVFHNQFGNFDALRKRVPGAHSGAFKEDTFTEGFGNFDVSKRSSSSSSSSSSEEHQTTGGYEKLKDLVNDFVNSESKARNGTGTVFFKQQTNTNTIKN